LDIPTFILFGVDIIRFLIDLGTAYALFLAVSLTLNLEAGFAGVPNFGKVMFVAAGAVAAAAVSGRLAAFILGVDTHGNFNAFIAQIIPQVNSSLSNNALLSLELLLLGILLAAVIGAGFGFLASYPAIRLREDYLGMFLLAAAQLFQVFLGGYEPLIGGTQGIQVPDLFAWAGNGIEVRDVVVLLFVVIFAGLVFLYVERVSRSPLGRTLRAVRDNEVAARAMGKNDVVLRRNVIIVASAISAMAGALLTFYGGGITSDTWTRITWTFFIWVMLIIGGAANNTGVALGAFSFTFLYRFAELVRFYFSGSLPFDLNWFEYMMFAALLILILYFRPGGILSEKSSVTLPWRTLAEVMRSRSEIGTRSTLQQSGPEPPIPRLVDDSG